MTAHPERTVFVVDDDAAVRRATRALLKTVGLEVEECASAFEFLERFRPGRAGCALLDIRMPGMSGLALQEELNRRKIRVPIVFLTAHGDVSMAVDAMHKGAHDFLEKPFDDQRLLYSVLNALRLSAAPPEAEEARVASPESLSPREQDVLERVLAGKPSKLIADELHITEKTVEFHRARIRTKLGVRTLAELFRTCLANGRAADLGDVGGDS